LIGIAASIIEIEIDLKKGLPFQSIVGLPDTAVKEARERVSAAIRNSGFQFPLGSLTINLAPADLKKVGSIFDLAIAVGVLLASNQIEGGNEIESYIFVGELSLDGTLRPVKGVLSIAEKARDEGIRTMVLPMQNYYEASLIKGLSLCPVASLGSAAKSFGNKTPPSIPVEVKGSRLKPVQNKETTADFSEVRGQNYAIRAAAVAAAGGHNLLFIGSPGSGKTMIANRIPGILPPMTETESLETTKIYSAAGLLQGKDGLIDKRPFRMPHHTASDVSIVGGGRNPIPGEITLAHNGVLFMDEFPEFKNNIIQALRQPLENGYVTVSRADCRFTYPARFMLVAAMNPCPCGHLFDPDCNCRCSRRHINRYFMKISGPILDRIAIQVVVKPVKPYDVIEGKPSESTENIRLHVMRAQAIQHERFGRTEKWSNASMSAEQIKSHCSLGRATRSLLYDAAKTFRLTARSYHKILQVARTVADLDERDHVSEADLLEALSYREVERILYGEQAPVEG
jgi:magnesium chelatase family protein